MDQSCSWKQKCFHHIGCIIYCGFPCCSFSGGCSWSDHEGTVQTHSEDRGSIWALPGSGAQLYEGDPSCEHQLRGVWELEDDSGCGLAVTRRCWGLRTLKSWDVIPRHISHLSFCECVNTKLTKQSCEISDCESVRKGEGEDLVSFAILLLRAPLKPSQGPFFWAFWETRSWTPGKSCSGSCWGQFPAVWQSSKDLGYRSALSMLPIQSCLPTDEHLLTCWKSFFFHSESCFFHSVV